MTELEKQIAEIFELDAKRTPGEWIGGYGTIQQSVEGNCLLCILKNGEWNANEYDCVYASSAPKMVEIIRQQQEIIKGLSETIERRRLWGVRMIERMEVAKEALRPLAEVSKAIKRTKGNEEDCGIWRGQKSEFEEVRLTVADARNAKQALAIIEPKEN